MSSFRINLRDNIEKICFSHIVFSCLMTNIDLFPFLRSHKLILIHFELLRFDFSLTLKLKKIFFLVIRPDTCRRNCLEKYLFGRFLLRIYLKIVAEVDFRKNYKLWAEKIDFIPWTNRKVSLVLHSKLSLTAFERFPSIKVFLIRKLFKVWHRFKTTTLESNLISCLKNVEWKI